MTWSEFTGALTTVARRGTLDACTPEVRQKLIDMGMVSGSTADPAGLTLTPRGRGWYQRAVLDRENERILAAYGHALDRVFDLDKPRDA